MSESITSNPDPNSNNAAEDLRRKIKISPELADFITECAARRGVSREEYLATAVRFFEDRANCDYIVELAFLLREQAFLSLLIEQLTISNRVLAEALLSLEGGALRALIQTAIVAKQLSAEADEKRNN